MVVMIIIFKDISWDVHNNYKLSNCQESKGFERFVITF